MSYYPMSEALRARVRKVAKLAYPDWRGRKLYLKVDDVPSQLDSWWDGGSRDEWRFVHLLTGQVQPVHSNHPVFEAQQPRHLSELPVEIAIVRHEVFTGRDAGCTVYCRPEALGIGITAPRADLVTDGIDEYGLKG